MKNEAVKKLDTDGSNIAINDNSDFEQYSDKELFLLYKKDKNISLRNELIKRNLYLAEILSKKYDNKGLEHEDLYQVASLALIYAIERFDVELGYEFSSFATPTIIGEIKKHFRDKGWLIKVPRKIKELSKEIYLSKMILQQELQRSVNIDDLEDYLSMSKDKLLEAIEVSYMYKPKSLEINVDVENENEVRLLDLIGIDDNQFNYIEVSDFVNSCIMKLNDIERKIIEDRYFNDKTQAKISSELNISQMTVSRLEKKALEKCRLEMNKLNNI